MKANKRPMTEKQTRKAKEHLSNLASAQYIAKAHQ